MGGNRPLIIEPDQKNTIIFSYLNLIRKVYPIMGWYDHFVLQFLPCELWMSTKIQEREAISWDASAPWIPNSLILQLRLVKKFNIGMIWWNAKLCSTRGCATDWPVSLRIQYSLPSSVRILSRGYFFFPRHGPDQVRGLLLRGRRWIPSGIELI